MAERLLEDTRPLLPVLQEVDVSCGQRGQSFCYSRSVECLCVSHRVTSGRGEAGEGERRVMVQGLLDITARWITWGESAPISSISLPFSILRIIETLYRVITKSLRVSGHSYADVVP